MQDLKVTLLQSNLHWHQPQANLAMFEEQIWSIDGSTDVIILPEMFNTGFTMEAHGHAEPMGTQTFKWLQQMAQQTAAAITGSYIVKEGGNYFNRLLWVTPDGKHLTYDKRHLFRMAEEHLTFTMGVERLITIWKGWKVCPQICYDLRFPVWSRNITSEGLPAFDLLLFVANWPKPRISAWDVLLRARSIENSCYTIGVNRIGNDGNEIAYNGHSTVVDPKGKVIFFEEEVEVIKSLTLRWQEIEHLRAKFPVHLDADKFNILN
jgi:predicted amidohydrolase